MTDAMVVARKLAVMLDHLDRVRRRRPDALEDLKTDSDRQDALAMSLLVVVQESLDLAFHLVTDEGWGLPASYAESFEILAQRGVIDAGLASALAASARLRNRIAHGYASVDIEKLWAELPSGIAAFESYATALARWSSRNDGA
jgi:uncharacterized protein YutE (UPF0331/DUF86 family)